MLKTLSLKKKVGIGHGVLICLLLLLCGAAIVSITGLAGYAQEIATANSVLSSGLLAMNTSKNSLNETSFAAAGQKKTADPAILRALQEAARARSTDENPFEAAVNARRNLIIMTVAAVMLAIVFSKLAAADLDKTLIQVLTSIKDGSGQVRSVSKQLLNTSRYLSTANHEQVEKIEAISTAIEDLTSQIEQNAENARQSSILANESAASAAAGFSAVSGMLEKMDTIRGSARQMAVIVKTIDEIAFQTNLLAINAAVEAAHAGDAGRGFAVVAQEVRNLAKKTAEAAQHTAELIRSSQKNADEGYQESLKFKDILGSISDKSGGSAAIIHQVSSLCTRQTQSIFEINQAINDMDRTTQFTAASSEASVAVSQQLRAQVRDFDDLLKSLDKIAKIDAPAHATGAGKKTRTTPRARLQVVPGSSGLPHADKKKNKALSQYVA